MKTITTLDALVAAAGKRQSVTNWKPNTEDNPKPAAWVLNWQGSRLVWALRAGLKLYTPKSGKWKRRKKADADIAEYRMLKETDTIFNGDEFYSDVRRCWIKTENIALHMQPEWVGKYRRPIKKDSK